MDGPAETAVQVSDSRIPAYDADYVGWLEAQVALLRAGRLDALDVSMIAEELEDVGKSEARALRSALTLVIMHMLKWDHQPERRTRSWVLTIRQQRSTVEEALEESPSLRPRLAEAIMRAYPNAVLSAAAETNLPLSAFPKTCPYTLEAILTRAHPWPDLDG
jgi:hypothetical protein